MCCLFQIMTSTEGSRCIHQQTVIQRFLISISRLSFKDFEYQVSILKSTQDHCFFAACLARYHVVCVQYTCHSVYYPVSSGFNSLTVLNFSTVDCVLYLFMILAVLRVSVIMGVQCPWCTNSSCSPRHWGHSMHAPG